MAQSLKNLKQDFVSNLTGGTINEINLVTAVAPVIFPPAAPLARVLANGSYLIYRQPISSMLHCKHD